MTDPRSQHGRRALRAAATLIAALWFAGPATACPGPSAEVHHYPGCQVPLPEAGAYVAVVDLRIPATALADHHPGDADRRTRLVTVRVAESDARIWLLLSAPDAPRVIWRLTGDVDSVSRAVVLEEASGPSGGAGVIGLPRDRIHFAVPDPAALAGVEVNSCTRLHSACIPAQWFGDDPGPKVVFHPGTTQPRRRADETVLGRTHRERPASGMLGSSPGLVSLVPPDVPNEVVAVDPAQMVSRNPPMPYEPRPGQPGLDALVAEGALVPAGSPEAEAAARAYGAAFAARYGTRLASAIGFVPEIDYLVTRKTALPPLLPPLAFLVAGGVPDPDMGGNDGTAVCLYRADEANRPAPGPELEGHSCRTRTVSLAIPLDQQEVLRAAAEIDRLDGGTVRDEGD